VAGRWRRSSGLGGNRTGLELQRASVTLSISMMADATANGGRPCLLLLASSLWLAFFPLRVGFIFVLYVCERGKEESTNK
jgi:hypothetical protein